MSIIVFSIFAFILNGCDLFETRNPQEPDTNQSSFQPPISDFLVISNFENAIKEKNVENYRACFSDINKSDVQDFIFVPSAEAMARFSVIFDNWNIESEKNAFLSLVTGLDEGFNPELQLINLTEETRTPDSTIFIGDYNLKIPNANDELSETYIGKLQFTIKVSTNGLWSISRWIDIASDSNSDKETWSILKASMSN